MVGAIISSLSESLHRARRRVAANERRYAVTLSSIGDAVIATDNPEMTRQELAGFFISNAEVKWGAQAR